jgi:uncharacterized protein
MTTDMSLTEQNRAVVAALYDAGARGDVPGLLSHLAEDVVVHEPAFLPYGGDYVGRDAFLAMFGEIGKYLDLSAISLEYLVADGERVIGVLRIPDRATGEQTMLAEQSTLRDGEVVEMRIFYYDPQSIITAVNNTAAKHTG